MRACDMGVSAGGKKMTEMEKLTSRVEELEDRMAKKDTEFAVINTKLSAILWGIGVVGTATIGMLIKMLFGV